MNDEEVVLSEPVTFFDGGGGNGWGGGTLWWFAAAEVDGSIVMPRFGEPPRMTRLGPLPLPPPLETPLARLVVVDELC